MAQKINNRGTSPVLNAAYRWIRACPIEDTSILAKKRLWTPSLVDEVRQAVVEHPDTGKDDITIKLKGQMEHSII